MITITFRLLLHRLEAKRFKSSNPSKPCEQLVKYQSSSSYSLPMSEVNNSKERECCCQPLDSNGSPTTTGTTDQQLPLHSHNRELPHSPYNQHDLTTTLPEVHSVHNSTSHFDPLLQLFLTTVHQGFQSNPMHDRQTLLFLSNRIKITEDDHGLNAINYATNLDYQRALTNRRRANRLYSRVLNNSQYPFRDLLSDTDDSYLNDDNSSNSDGRNDEENSIP
jgi:hypothetical protein